MNPQTSASYLASQADLKSVIVIIVANYSRYRNGTASHFPLKGFSSEAGVLSAGKPQEAEAWLRERGLVYDGMLEAPKGEVAEDWEPVELPLFRSTQFGDDQDRPIRKSDGSWTYFGIDLA